MTDYACQSSQQVIQITVVHFKISPTFLARAWINDTSSKKRVLSTTWAQHCTIILYVVIKPSHCWRRLQLAFFCLRHNVTVLRYQEGRWSYFSFFLFRISLPRLRPSGLLRYFFFSFTKYIYINKLKLYILHRKILFRNRALYLYLTLVFFLKEVLICTIAKYRHATNTFHNNSL
jgi:hypothetical protein